jgi:hypothetical protein
VKEVTDNVPHELLNMVYYIHKNLAKGVLDTAGQLSATDIGDKILKTADDDDILLQLHNFIKDRHDNFYKKAEIYFNTALQPTQRYAQHYALAAMFLPQKDDDTDFNSNYRVFDYRFMDLGLVYWVWDGACIQYHPLCQAAKSAFLDLSV